ncbi:hypothetical protein Tco_0520964 [Tanacetum coccineum]
MNQEKIRQVAARDEKWVPTKERAKISATNVRPETTVPQKEETFQVIIDVIKNSTCYKAFTISAEVPEIFMQQFLYTVKKVKGTNSYEFLLANKKCLVDAEVFWKTLDIYLRVQRVEFTKVPDNESTLTFLINLGYKDDGVVSRLKFVRISKEFQEYGLPIPETMLTKGIKQSESYQMFIKYSTRLIPSKKSKDDNIIPEPDVSLELGKSMSLTEAAEEEAARQVHATHERIMIESNLEPARRRPPGIAFRDTSIVSKKDVSWSVLEAKGSSNSNS